MPYVKCCFVVVLACERVEEAGRKRVALPPIAMTNLQLSSQFTSSRNPPPDSARRTFWLRSCVTVLSGVLLSCGTASEGHSTAEETGHTQDDLVLCPLNCDDNNPCTQDQCVFRLVGSSLQPTCSHSSVAAGTSCSLAGSSCQDTCSANGICLPQGAAAPRDRTVPSTVESVSSFLRSCSLQAPLTAQSMTATRGSRCSGAWSGIRARRSSRG